MEYEDFPCPHCVYRAMSMYNHNALMEVLDMDDITLKQSRNVMENTQAHTALALDYDWYVHQPSDVRAQAESLIGPVVPNHGGMDDAVAAWGRLLLGLDVSLENVGDEEMEALKLFREFSIPVCEALGRFRDVILDPGADQGAMPDCAGDPNLN